MRYLILMTLVLSMGCGCPDRPDTWKGAELTGCSDAGDVTCCSYSGDSCSYIVCQESCGDWEQESWACY